MRLVGIELQFGVVLGVRVGHEHEPKIIVKMRWHIAARRNGVHVDIEKPRVIRARDEFREPDFLRHLALRRSAPRGIGFFNVPSGLQPFVELAMVSDRLKHSATASGSGITPMQGVALLAMVRGVPIALNHVLR